MNEDFGPIINTPGHNGVDFETRVDFDRLRAYRLARAREALDKSDLGAILPCYWLLTRGGEPMVWDFGSAARHHQLFAPWLEPDNCKAGMLGLRGAIADRKRTRLNS